MIGKLLGHADIQSTARYAHLARETERVSAARVGASIGADIAPAAGAPGRTARRELFGEPAGARLNYRVRRGRPPCGPGHGDLGPRAHRLRRPRLSLRRQGLRRADPGPGAGTKRITVGRHGVIGAAEARRRAALIIARVHAGEDPERPAQKPAGPTLAALAERYLREHVAVRCKPSTAAQYRLAIERYIVPALGERAVSEIGRSHVADLQHALRDRPAMANLVIATLSRLIDQAVAWGVVQETTNPCRSAQKYRVRRRERFLTDAEFRRLGSGPGRAGGDGAPLPPCGIGHPPAHAHRLPAQRDPDAALGGCAPGGPRAAPAGQQDRPPHDLALRRGGGRSGRHPQGAGQPLGHPRHQAGAAALQHLRAVEPCARPRRPRRRAHPRPPPFSYASRALALGESLPVIAKLLGHAQIQTTARYTHLTRDSVKDAATRVANDIAQGYILDRCHPPDSTRDRRERGRGRAWAMHAARSAPTKPLLREIALRHRPPGSRQRSGRTSSRPGCSKNPLRRPVRAPARWPGRHENR